ncbi:MAG: hypothetical protein KF725_03905 [Cyclobacteriaceae bacterium]|jgi:transcription elongation factor Elf1|nr:hypothetical protein [Cyclobacteriaceae bacterium]MBX2958062.1 hypothetical protein [Cyclobacteriaceae bacterium]UYN85635.1 MAG: hypothetical protein KIT51_12185 [Cyclobacteriaceae bacterium]HRJ29829.1 HNH endonuclease [Cyclobacteriaceae bacterium]HRJ81448.1 HNH endonuclease [Cyclobacteriaceae bacterium]
MVKGQDKRRLLFDRYSAQLESMKELGVLGFDLKYEKAFICPLCLEQFSVDDLDTSKENFLTLEDAPPKSLGGKANTLTCKKCNNRFGHEIDFHLVEKLNELDVYSFQPKSGSKASFTHNGVKVQGIVNVDDKGNITVTHLEKTNNPGLLNKYVKTTGKGDTTTIKFPVSRVDFKKFEVALLKTAYILAFEHYGYPLILSKAFDIVRAQLKNPTKDIYPTGFWTRQAAFNETNTGVHLIKTLGLEGFQAIFLLKTQSRTTGFGVYLPVSHGTVLEVIERLKDIPAGFEMRFESFKNTDYFDDKTNQKMCVDFMKKRNE